MSTPEEIHTKIQEEELFNTIATREEVEYILKAIKANVQSTEILNTIVIARCNNYVLRNLVSAMENPVHMVYKLYPDEVQKCYTIVKIIIKQVYNQSLVQ